MNLLSFVSVMESLQVIKNVEGQGWKLIQSEEKTAGQGGQVIQNTEEKSWQKLQEMAKESLERIQARPSLAVRDNENPACRLTCTHCRQLSLPVMASVLVGSDRIARIFHINCAKHLLAANIAGRAMATEQDASDASRRALGI